MDFLRRQRMRKRRGLWRARICVCATFTALLVSRPVRLSSVRWWRAPELAAAIRLTEVQRDAIDRIYERRLRDRRRCIERMVEASNRVDQLMRDGIFDDETLHSTQAASSAADEERMVRRVLNDEIVRVLSPEQRGRLVSLLAGRVLE